MPTVAIRSPVGGLHRRFTRQQEPPHTTDDCLNVRGFDPFEERERIGVRPGLTEDNLFAGFGDAPINMLSCVNVGGQNQNLLRSFHSFFPNSQLPEWTRDEIIVTAEDWRIADRIEEGRAYTTLPTTINLSRPYEFHLMLNTRVTTEGSFQAEGLTGIARIDIGVKTIDPFDTENWVRVELAADFNLVNSELEIRRHQFMLVTVFRMHFGNVDDATVIPESDNDKDPSRIFDWVRLSTFIDPSSRTVRVKLETNGIGGTEFDFESEEIFTGNLNDPDAENNYMGFSLKKLQEINSRRNVSPRVRRHTIIYTQTLPPVFPTPDCLVVMASGGKVFADTGNQTVREADGVIEQTQRPVMAIDMIAPPNDEVARTAGPLLFIADYMDSGGIQPKVYDPVSGRLYPWVADVGAFFNPDDNLELNNKLGDVPTGNHIISRYAGRIYLAGDPPHAWQACAIGNPFHWLNVPDDPTTALVGQAGGTDDIITEPITAMIPYIDNYQIFCTANRLYRMTGDKAFGGQTHSISEDAGCAGPTAWCLTPEGAIVILDSERGLFILLPGANSTPVAISDERLPRELKKIDPKSFNISLVYDHIRVGVNIFLTSVEGHSIQHWWFDWRNKSFWLDNYIPEHEPIVALGYQGVDPDRSGVLLGSRDGKLRRVDSTTAMDDGVPFENRILLGPFMLGGASHIDGSVEWIRATIEPEGAIVNWRFSTGANAKRTLTQPDVREEGTIGGEDASQVRESVFARGATGYLELTGIPGKQWALESLDLNVERIAEAIV